MALASHIAISIRVTLTSGYYVPRWTCICSAVLGERATGRDQALYPFLTRQEKVRSHADFSIEIVAPSCGCTEAAIRADLGMQSNHPVAEVVANCGHIVPALPSCVGGALTVQLLPSLDVLI